jgi:ATP-dependent DNA helicase DinG
MIGSPVSRLPLADAPLVAAGLRAVAWVSSDGEVEALDHRAAAARLAGRPERRTPPVLCHRPAIARRLGVDRFPALDLLELYAFVRPARFCLPTPRGLAAALGLPRPGDLVAARGAAGR